MTVAAPDTAAKLVQLSQAEPVGAVDEDGVGAFGRSRPFSTIVVQTRMSYFTVGRSDAPSSPFAPAVIWPWPISTLAEGTSSLGRMFGDPFQ